MPNWNPIQYEKFLKDRTQPAIDLASRLEVFAPNSILDLGCGPGNSTKVIKDKSEQLAEAPGVTIYVWDEEKGEVRV